MPPRFDLHTPAHKGLRRALMNAVAAAGNLDAADADALAAYRAEYARVIAYVRIHTRIEDETLHPTLHERRPGACDLANAEHVRHAATLEELDAQVAALGDGAAEAAPGRALAHYETLTAFMTEMYSHLEWEEGNVRPALWDAFSDDELRALQGRIIGGLAPEEFRLLIGIMLPAMNHGERAGMFGGLKAKAPEATFTIASDEAQARLAAADWKALAAAVGI